MAEKATNPTFRHIFVGGPNKEGWYLPTRKNVQKWQKRSEQETGGW